MKKILISSILCLILAVIIFNYFPIIPLYLRMEPIMRHYQYESSDGGFQANEIEGKSIPYSQIQTNFEQYKKENKLPESIVLCRNFKKNYWKFWKWRTYWTNPRYQLPYKESTAKKDPKEKE